MELPDFLPARSLEIQRPLLRPRAVFRGAVEPGLLPLAVGGNGQALRVPHVIGQDRLPPDAAPLKEDGVPELEVRAPQAAQGGPGRLRGAAVIAVVPTVGEVIGGPGVGLSLHVGVGFDDFCLAVQDLLLPGLGGGDELLGLRRLFDLLQLGAGVGKGRVLVGFIEPGDGGTRHAEGEIVIQMRPAVHVIDQRLARDGGRPPREAELVGGV